MPADPWLPHLHLLVTDGGFRPEGTFVSWPAHDQARLTEAFRRAVLPLFVRLDLFDEDQAAGMLTWPHSGFHVHTAVWVPEENRAFATWLARYCARNPVAVDPLAFLVHIPDKGHVTTRYYGWYANRGMQRQADPVVADVTADRPPP